MHRATPQSPPACRSRQRPGPRSAAPALFAAAFASQSAAFVLAPMLPRLASGFGVPVGTVGQARTVSGAVAAATPFAVAALARRAATRDLILAGLLLTTAGAVVAGSAGGLPAFLAAHAILGVGLAVVIASSLTASAEWAPPTGHEGLLMWTTMGMGAAAVVATPLAGALVLLDWRAAWVVPAVAGAVALALIARRPAEPPLRHVGDGSASVWHLPGVAAWCAGEFFAYAGWSIITIYSAALLIETYGLSALQAGLTVGASAAAFLAGNRIVRSRLTRPRVLLAVMALAMAAFGAAFALVRIGYWPSALLLVLLGLLNGARNPAGSAFGLILSPRDRPQLMSARTSAQSLGYLVGAACGGVVLAATPHLSAVLGALRPLSRRLIRRRVNAARVSASSR